MTNPTVLPTNRQMYDFLANPASPEPPGGWTQFLDGWLGFFSLTPAVNDDDGKRMAITGHVAQKVADPAQADLEVERVTPPPAPATVVAAPVVNPTPVVAAPAPATVVAAPATVTPAPVVVPPVVHTPPPTTPTTPTRQTTPSWVWPVVILLGTILFFVSVLSLMNKPAREVTGPEATKIRFAETEMARPTEEPTSTPDSAATTIAELKATNEALQNPPATQAPTETPETEGLVEVTEAVQPTATSTPLPSTVVSTTYTGTSSSLEEVLKLAANVPYSLTVTEEDQGREITILSGFDIGEFGGDDSACALTELDAVKLHEEVSSPDEACKLIVEWSLKFKDYTVISGFYAMEPGEWFRLQYEMADGPARFVGTFWYLPKGWNAHMLAGNLAADWQVKNPDLLTIVGLSPTDPWVQQLWAMVEGLE